MTNVTNTKYCLLTSYNRAIRFVREVSFSFIHSYFLPAYYWLLKSLNIFDPCRWVSFGLSSIHSFFADLSGPFLLALLALWSYNCVDNVNALVTTIWRGIVWADIVCVFRQLSNFSFIFVLFLSLI